MKVVGFQIINKKGDKMSSNCNHDCASCSSSSTCASKIEKEKANEFSSIKKIYAVISGKGGVGKSMVTSLMAVYAKRQGKKVAVIDADITGPSIPKVFGATQKAVATENGILPVLTGSGIEIISINSLLQNDSDPVVWRGPVIAGAVKQFYTDVLWGDVDTMFVDCPPGTGDVPLTVFQSLPIDGIIVVTSPQELVSMIVEKAVKMAELMHVPILGIVENMSYFKCPDCGKQHFIFGKGKTEDTAKKYDIKNICRLPIDSSLADMADGGQIEFAEIDEMEKFVENIIK